MSASRPARRSRTGRRSRTRGGRRSAAAETEALVVRYQGLVRAMALRFFPQRAQDEDLLQCGLIGLWEASRTWRGNGKFTVYARRSILNNMRDYLRAESRAPAAELPAGREEWESHEDKTIDRLDMLARIRNAWPENSRERYVLLALCGGASWHAAAAALGVQLHTVRRIAVRAMKGLR